MLYPTYGDGTGRPCRLVTAAVRQSPAVTDHPASVAPQRLATPGSSGVAGEVLHIDTEIGSQLGDRGPRLPKHHLVIPLLLGERFNQILLDEWAYDRPYTSDHQRFESLKPWIHDYNWHL